MAQAEARTVERSCGAAARGRSADHVQPFVERVLAVSGPPPRGGDPGASERRRPLIGIGRETLGVDTFDISGSSADTTASAGKYISDNVCLEVQQGVTSGSAKAKLEIELTPSISAEVQIGQQGTGSSLNWTYDY